MRFLIGGFVAINVVVLVVQLMMRLSADPPPKPVVTPPSQAIANAPPIKLLSELDSSTVDAMRRPSGEPETQSSSLCTLVGPFNRLLDAEYFEERLIALELQAAVSELKIPGEPNYWVYLPSQGSSKQAFSTLRELQAKGIDSYVIPDGELENGISFGMFSRKELADRRLEAMQKDGYAVELKEVARSYQEIWVVLQPGEAGRLSQETWQQMLAAEEDQLERRQNYCPPVASE